MTEEEIRPIAEDYVEEYCHCSDGEYTDGSLVCAGIGTALIVSRQLEKRIVELNDQLTKANKLLDEFLDFESSCMERGIYISDKIRAEANQFLKENSTYERIQKAKYNYID